MADQTCIWTGASGTQYKYWVYPRGTSVDEGSDGNYVYCKLNGENKWVPIYFGEGSLSDRTSSTHHRRACIDKKGATHVHMHLNKTEAARRAEEQDLLARFKNALEPHGCNVSPTG